MIKQIDSILQNSWLELASRWILGLTFIYASYNKILFPADFAKIIYGYDLFPATLINLIAIILPYLELVAALALIFGVYPRSAVFIVNALLVAFIILLSINLIRGHEFNCGCFALQNSANNVSSQTTIIRDFVYLALGLQVYFYNRYRRWCLRQKGISQLHEIVRVMKTDGMLAIVEFKKIDGPPGPPVHIRLSPEEVSDMLVPYGFTKGRQTEIGPFNYLMLLKK